MSTITVPEGCASLLTLFPASFSCHFASSHFISLFRVHTHVLTYFPTLRTSYVAASVLSSVFLLTWQGIKVSGARKAAGIAYPRLYAEKAEMDASPAALKFNCVQRAHANTLENIASIYAIAQLITTMTLTGPPSQRSPLHPVAAAALGSWVVSRVLYTNGYATGVPASRTGPVMFLTYIPAMLTLLGGSIYTVYTLLSSGI
ncbi:hypothetical protein MSAN_00907300 [Mycena sanguinolenta]|uniref:MAPEG family protein n=1 Tax=Mycena sanguinolenta TaxID=230812 RepID=A0A8H6YYA7_9AGAR|nr:hypothetical protein MSAN_00907300 [Mycena sanguinolenta]